MHLEYVFVKDNNCCSYDDNNMEHTHFFFLQLLFIVTVIILSFESLKNIPLSFIVNINTHHSFLLSFMLLPNVLGDMNEL